MSRQQHRRITAQDMAHRRTAQGQSLTPGQLAAVERERSSLTTDDAPDPLLALPGVMQALWWSHCRGCSALIHGPGSTDLPCPCGTTHARGDTVGLAATDSGRAWVCRPCLEASLSGEVPAPRGGQWAAEVAQ